VNLAQMAARSSKGFSKTNHPVRILSANKHEKGKSRCPSDFARRLRIAYGVRTGSLRACTVYFFGYTWAQFHARSLAWARRLESCVNLAQMAA
jgi:hypothetical protein